MKKNKIVISILLLVLVGCGYYFYKSAKDYEAYELSTAKHNELLAKAMNHDIDAKRQLYKNYIEADRFEQALMWARSGAIAGAEDMIKIYVEMYKKLSLADQEVQRRILNKNPDKAGARKTLEEISKT